MNKSLLANATVSFIILGMFVLLTCPWMVPGGNTWYDAYADVISPPKRFEMGFVVQRQLVENQAKADRLTVEFNRLKAESIALLSAVYKANGIVFKRDENWNLDFKTWTLEISDKDGLCRIIRFNL